MNRNKILLFGHLSDIVGLCLSDFFVCFLSDCFSGLRTRLLLSLHWWSNSHWRRWERWLAGQVARGMVFSHLVSLRVLREIRYYFSNFQSRYLSWKETLSIIFCGVSQSMIIDSLSALWYEINPVRGHRGRHIQHVQRDGCTLQVLPGDQN